ncbi:MAG: diguanylate cyclase [Planctomycetes bacterium]|nr:diguanylate cyclase [Planctomycetota bacterium]
MGILIVDDSEHVHTQLRFFLTSSGYQKLTFAESAAEAYACLEIDSPQPAADKFDLILMDIMMPDIDGIEACRRIKKCADFKDIPIIMVTGKTDIEYLQIAFSEGAVDYITKPINKVELLARVRSVLRLKHEIDHRKSREKELIEVTRQLEAANQMLLQLSFSDALTGVANRRSFEKIYSKEWGRVARHSRPISLIMIDIDYFKLYNDTYGHPQGDVCLKQVAKALRDALKRPGDVVARYGGEEFVIVLPDTDTEGACQIAESIRVNIDTLRLEFKESLASNQVTVSMGISTTVPDINTLSDSLINSADKALYQAKSEGRNRVKISQDNVT